MNSKEGVFQSGLRQRKQRRCDTTLMLTFTYHQYWWGFVKKLKIKNSFKVLFIWTVLISCCNRNFASPVNSGCSVSNKTNRPHRKTACTCGRLPLCGLEGFHERFYESVRLCMHVRACLCPGRGQVVLWSVQGVSAQLIVLHYCLPVSAVWLSTGMFGKQPPS